MTQGEALKRTAVKKYASLALYYIKLFHGAQKYLGEQKNQAPMSHGFKSLDISAQKRQP